MYAHGIQPNIANFSYVLRRCIITKSLLDGQNTHFLIILAGLEHNDELFGNLLITMYAKCGLIGNAREVFNRIQVRDTVLWNSLMTGYAEHGYSEEMLDCLEQMHIESTVSDVVTFVCGLKASSDLRDLRKGKEIHAKLVMENLEKRADIGTVLIDMYAKCGLLTKAQEVFDQLSAHNVATWSVLIAGYGQWGKDDTVVDLFDKMIGEGIQPDVVTFTAVLNSCSHSGLVDRGQMYFEKMSKAYGTMPTLEHYTCMADLFARTGHLDKTVAAIKEMPMNACVEAWSTLLGACRKWGNMDLGRVAFEHATVLDEKHVAAYVCMWNIYAVASIQENAEQELNGVHMEFRNVIQIQAEDKWPF